MKASYLRHREKRIAEATEWNRKNPEKRKATLKRYAEKHKDKESARSRAKYQKNKQRVKDYSREHSRHRRATEPAFAMTIRLRNRLRHALKGKLKTETTMYLVGCSAIDLKTHIEAQFAEGMSWANRHQWHLDHIIPCASFDMTNPEHRAACFHFTNLRPLWAAENRSKGRKVMP